MEILGITPATVDDYPQMNTSIKVIEEALAEVPMLDIHTHLIGGRLGARGLHDLLLYHMVISDLYAARLSQRGALDAISRRTLASRGPPAH